jgi:formylglycine-generating enzyme required for sulfatase activity
VLEEDAAIVLVLIPGETFRMGAQADDADGPNYDPEAVPTEGPVREVTLEPYLIAKHECTQAQWAAMTEGGRPSHFQPGRLFGDKLTTARNPVECVSWEDASLWLGRHRLVLPTEAQWEHACRAGTDTPWFTGDRVQPLSAVANVADAYYRKHGRDPSLDYTDQIEDGYGFTAPVGRFDPNHFGLHDVHGNVWEWCADAYRASRGDADDDGLARGSPLRVIRGGCWRNSASCCRSSARLEQPQDTPAYTLGIRPAARLVR